MSAAGHRITFSSTTREYIDGVFFFSSYFTSWILVPSFMFHVRFYFYLHDGHFIICHYLHLKIKIHKINCQFCDQNKCLYTLNELNFYRCFSFSFFLVCQVWSFCYFKLSSSLIFLYGSSVFHCSQHSNAACFTLRIFDWKKGIY